MFTALTLFSVSGGVVQELYIPLQYLNAYSRVLGCTINPSGLYVRSYAPIIVKMCGIAPCSSQTAMVVESAEWKENRERIKEETQRLDSCIIKTNI